MTRTQVNVDGDQYSEIKEYTKASGATAAFVIREAIADWIRWRKPERMAAFQKKQKRADDK